MRWSGIIGAGPLSSWGLTLRWSFLGVMSGAHWDRSWVEERVYFGCVNYSILFMMRTLADLWCEERECAIERGGG